jgi:hypothetical protein
VGREKISSARPTEIPIYASSPFVGPMAIEVAETGMRPLVLGLANGCVGMLAAYRTNPRQEKRDEVLIVVERDRNAHDCPIESRSFYEKDRTVLRRMALKRTNDRKDASALFRHRAFRRSLRRIRFPADVDSCQRREQAGEACGP